MNTVATLDSSVRLVVLQLLMKKELVPEIIPPKRVSNKLPLSPVSGVEILKSTSGVNIFNLANEIGLSKDYELVDVWKIPQETNWKMSFVRFVYCRKEYVDHGGLHPDFITKSGEFAKALIRFVSDNLWAVQGHLNPYLEKDGSRSGHRVLMFGCAGRRPDVEVFRDGRDENNRGVGPKVLLSTLASELRVDDDRVVFVKPDLTRALTDLVV